MHLAHLQHLLRMIRADTERLTAVDDILTQSQSKTGNALLGRFVLDGIEVERTQHTADGGIVIVAMLLPHHLLQHDGHLLLVDDVGCCRHVSLRIFVEHRSVDTLDGVDHHTQHLVFVAGKGHHVGSIDTGEGLVVAVFEQRTASDGDRLLRGLEEGEEVGDVLVGKLCPEEMLQNLFVGHVAQGYLVEVVRVHKLVEHIGAEHHRLGDAHLDALKLVELGMALDDVVEESQSAPLAAQGAIADAGKMAVGVEALAVEEGHDADVLHVTVFDDGIEDNLTVSIDILHLLERDVLQEVGHGEDSPGAEPAADMVARGVVEQRVARDVEDVVLQLLEVADAPHHSLRRGVAEDEVAKAEMLLQLLPEVDEHLLRILVDKLIPRGFGTRLVHRLGTLHDERDEGVVAVDILQELETGIGDFGIGSLLAVARAAGEHRKAAVADDTQHVVPIPIIYIHRLGMIARQDYLRPTAHAQGGTVRIERLGSEALALREDIAVERREDRRIEADAVFHQQNHLHTGLLDVVVEVHAVFDELDDGKDKVGVAQPAEHIVEDGHILVLDATGDAVREGGEHHAGDVGELRLDGMRHVEGVVVGRARHADDEVDIGGVQPLGRLFRRRHLPEERRIAQS